MYGHKAEATFVAAKKRQKFWRVENNNFPFHFERSNSQVLMNVSYYPTNSPYSPINDRIA